MTKSTASAVLFVCIQTRNTQTVESSNSRADGGGACLHYDSVADLQIWMQAV